MKETCELYRPITFSQQGITIFGHDQAITSFPQHVRTPFPTTSPNAISTSSQNTISKTSQNTKIKTIPGHGVSVMRVLP